MIKLIKPRFIKGNFEKLLEQRRKLAEKSIDYDSLGGYHETPSLPFSRSNKYKRVQEAMEAVKTRKLYQQ